MFETIVLTTDGSSSCGTVRLIKRCNARLSESEMGGDSGGWFVSPGGKGNVTPPPPNGPSQIPSEPVCTGGGASSVGTRFPFRNEFGGDAGESGSPDGLSYLRQLGGLKYSPIDNTDIVYIERTVSRELHGGEQQRTISEESAEKSAWTDPDTRS